MMVVFASSSREEDSSYHRSAFDFKLTCLATFQSLRRTLRLLSNSLGFARPPRCFRFEKDDFYTRLNLVVFQGRYL